jgi:hypothetical protein
MDTLQLELGTILKIIAPPNEELHDQVFIIQFIDDRSIELLNTETLETSILNILNGQISDESVEVIELLDIPEEKGYSKQNGLITGKWLDIHFGGDLPTILTGRIVNTENDAIEMELWNESKDHIFIDFAYKGIPKELPIEEIVIREAPESFKRSQPVMEEEEEKKEALDSTPNDVTSIEERKEGEPDREPISAPVVEPEDEIPGDDTPSLEDNREKLKEMLAIADEIEFGEDLGDLEIQVEVTDSEKRYSLQSQLNDLLDDLLSTIPDKERNQATLDKIDRKLLYFKQLREKFSTFDDNCFISAFKKNGYNFKPLLKKLYTLSGNLKTVLPVVKQKNIIYEDTKEDFEARQEQIESSGEITSTFRTQEPDSFIESLNSIYETYKNNEETVSNKFYDYIKSINNTFLPFDIPEDSELIFKDPIFVQNVAHTLVDNIANDYERFYSTVVKNKEVQTQRFVIQKYDLGLNKMNVSKMSSYGMTYEIEENSKPDRAYVQSIVMLPGKKIIDLTQRPNTSTIYEKTLQSHVEPQYWALFRKLSSIVTHEVEKDSVMEDMYDFTLVQHFISKEGFDDYKSFLQHVLPTTKYLLENVIESDGINQTTYEQVMKHLESFGILKKDIVFNDHKIILEIIERSIQKVRISLAEQKKKLVRMKKLVGTSTFSFQNYIQNTRLQDLYSIEGVDQNLSSLQEKYGILPAVGDSFGNTVYLQTSEALTRTQKADNNRVLYRFVNMANKMLYSNSNVEALLEEAISSKEKQLETDENSCKDKSLVKEYYSLDELEADNQTEVRHDKKFDHTNYMILEEYQSEQGSMTEEDFEVFLSDKLQDNIGLTAQRAKEDAKTMIRGHRLVEDGEYAVLILDETSGNPGRFYYVRKDNVWKYDTELTNTISQTKDESAFCNIKPSCLSLRKSCEDIDSIKNHTQKDSMKHILKTIEESFTKDQEALSAMFPELVRKDFHNLNLRLKYLLYRLTNNSTLRYNYGLQVELMDTPKSPHEGLMHRILGMKDHISKFSYLAKFLKAFTRDPLITLEEDEHWLYCKTSDVKLIPSFYKRLVMVAFSPVDYQEEIVRITDERGALSDAGDKYVDKYSGFEIYRIEFSDDQGYNEAGFKVNTYSGISEDPTLQVEESKQSTAKNLFYKRMENVFLSFVKQLNIQIMESKDFVIQNVIQDVTGQLGNREQIIKSLSERKKIQKYEKQHNILSMTLFSVYVLLAIQTNIPSIRKSRALPGCKASFAGFPYSAEGGTDGIEYIICALQTMANDQVEPWKNITKRKYKKDKFKENAMKLYESLVEHKSEVQERIRNKIEHISSGDVADDSIPEELSIQNWGRFMPFLQKIKMNAPKILPESYRKSLLEFMGSSNKKQHIAFNLMRDKQRALMNYIVMLIDNALSSEELYLYGKSGMYFLENTCCLESENRATYKYIVDKEKRVHDINKIIKKYTSMYYDLLRYDTPTYIQTLMNTKLLYPELLKNYSETTIYRSFIKHLNFNNNLSAPEYLKFLTQGRDINLSSENTLHEKIQVLKEKGFEFSEDQHNILIKLVNNKNSIENTFTNPIKSSRILTVQQILQSVYDDAESIIPKDFIQMLTSVVLTYDKKFKDGNMPENMKNLYDYVIETTKEQNDTLYEFMEEYMGGTSSDNRKQMSFVRKLMDNLATFKKRDASDLTSDENTDLAGISYMQQMLYQICVLIPYKIVHDSSSEKASKKLIPREILKKLSKAHASNLQQKLSTGYYVLFDKINKETNNLCHPTLLELNKQLRVLYQISNALPFILDKENESYPLQIQLVRDVLEFMVSFSLYQFSELERIDLISGEIDEVDLDSESKTVLLRRQKTHILFEVMKLMSLIKETTNTNNEEIRLNVAKLVDKEKDLTTGDLQAMTRDKREADRHFKIMGMGKYAIGLQKGLYEYDPSRYEFEQSELDRQLQGEKNEIGMISEAMKMYMNSDNLEGFEERFRESEIEREVNDISHLQGEDGDDMEYDEY